MADIPLTSVAGASGLPRLAPDLTFPSRIANAPYEEVNINPVGSLTTALSLTGRYAIHLLYFTNLTAETVTVKLTVDGEVKWNDTFTSGTVMNLLGTSSTVSASSDSIECNSSLLLEIQTATDTSVNLRFLTRPIL